MKAALANSEVEHKTEPKKRAIPRKAAGQTWDDPTLTDWPESESTERFNLSLFSILCNYVNSGSMYADDFRLFCGDLGNEVNDDVLSKAFSRFPAFNMARVSP